MQSFLNRLFLGLLYGAQCAEKIFKILIYLESVHDSSYLTMAKSKQIRSKGKISFSNYFKGFSDGDVIAVVRDLTLSSSFPKRMQGRTGKVIGSRGTNKIVEIKDGDAKKMFIIHPAHLKLLK